MTNILTPVKQRLQTCKDCRHFDPVPNDEHRRGMCHCNPPQVYGWVAHVKLPNGNVQEVPQNNTAWPILSDNQWCGQFTLNLLRTEMN